MAGHNFSLALHLGHLHWSSLAIAPVNPHLPDLAVLRRLHLVEDVLVFEETVLSVTPLSPGSEGDSPQTEVAGHLPLTLRLYRETLTLLTQYSPSQLNIRFDLTDHV